MHGDLPLAMALYRVMPCFANLMYVDHWAARPDFFAELCALLDEPDDALADPAAYWLWCGPFEKDEAAATEAWDAVTRGATERRLRRLLAVSGPVPWSAKADTLWALVPETEWHGALRHALTVAEADVYGRIDQEAAARILASLDDEVGASSR